MLRLANQGIDYESKFHPDKQDSLMLSLAEAIKQAAILFHPDKQDSLMLRGGSCVMHYGSAFHPDKQDSLMLSIPL